MNLNSTLCKVNINSNKLFVLLEPHSFFRFLYRLLTMTTFFEIAVMLLKIQANDFKIYHSQVPKMCEVTQSGLGSIKVLYQL